VRRPLRVEYEAAWTQRRGPGSCYLAVPGYLGSGQWSAHYASYRLQKQLVLSDNGSGLPDLLNSSAAPATLGFTQLEIDGGDVAASPPSVPADEIPSRGANPPLAQAPVETDRPNVMQWSCDVALPTREDASPQRPIRDCHSFVTVAASGAETVRSWLLFVLGVIVAFCIQLAYEARREWRRPKGDCHGSTGSQK